MPYIVLYMHQYIVLYTYIYDIPSLNVTLSRHSPQYNTSSAMLPYSVTTLPILYAIHLHNDTYNDICIH